MKTKVLFIVPPDISFSDLTKSGTEEYQTVIQTSPPLGMLYIASYTRKFADVDFKIVDLNLLISESPGITFYEWEQRVIETLSEVAVDGTFDIVGISALFNTNFGHLLQISKIARSLWPEALIVSGGALASNLYDDIFKNTTDIDAIAIAEAEKPFLGLVQAENKRAYLEEALGWMTPTRAKAGMAPATDFIIDLDEIPFPAWDLIQIDEYQRVTNWHGEKPSGTKVSSMMITRGCPYKCTYCANSSMHGSKMRYTSCERVFEDIRKLKEEYGINVFLIEDDNLIADKEYAIKILKGLAELDITVDISNGLAVNHLDEEILDAMKAMGLNRVTLAVESGCPRVLKELMHKPWSDLSLARKAVSLLRERDFFITGTFLIGLPGETRENVEECVQFIKEVGLNWSKIFIATPIAGSELYEICLKNNYFVTTNLEDYHFAKCTLRTPFFEPEELDKLKYLINLEVNFVENYDLKRNRPDVAAVSFKDVLRRVPNHAFAHFFLGRCYEKMGCTNLAEDCYGQYAECLNSDDRQWIMYARHFGLPIIEGLEASDVRVHEAG